MFEMRVWAAVFSSIGQGIKISRVFSLPGICQLLSGSWWCTAGRRGANEAERQRRWRRRQVSAGGEEKRQRRKKAEGGEQGAADCRQPRGIQHLGNWSLEQPLRRGSTLIPFLDLFLSLLLSSNLFFTDSLLHPITDLILFACNYPLFILKGFLS